MCGVGGGRVMNHGDDMEARPGGETMWFDVGTNKSVRPLCNDAVYRAYGGTTAACQSGRQKEQQEQDEYRRRGLQN